MPSKDKAAGKTPKPPKPPKPPKAKPAKAKEQDKEPRSSSASRKPRPKTKIVIRRLPHGLTADKFHEHIVSPFETDVTWSSFVPGFLR